MQSAFPTLLLQAQIMACFSRVGQDRIRICHEDIFTQYELCNHKHTLHVKWVCYIGLAITIYIQACRVVRYGTVTVCTVRTVLVKLRRTTVIVTPHFTVITVKYGTVYGTVLSWHCQCKNGLRMASSPQNLPFPLPGVLLPCVDATQWN